MNKIFLAAPFKSLVDETTNVMFEKEKNQIETLVTLLEEKGYAVHNAHKREKWGKEFMPPEQCTEIDFVEIENCDLFIAFPGKPPSPGTHIEIGWASALKKKIVILIHENIEDYAYLVRGLHVIAEVTYIVYHSDRDCRDKLEAYLQNEEQCL